MTPDPRTLFANHYAFLVGIDKYDHFLDLGGARSDAEAMYGALHGVGYATDNLWLVPEEKTSQRGIQKQIQQFIEKVEEAVERTRKGRSDPDILVFWAGHGFPGDHSSYLLTKTTNSLRNIDSEAISLQDLTDRLKRISPASLTMFFDVCHSIAREREDLNVNPIGRLLVPMRDAVKRPRNWAFVGVSTWAYEVGLTPHRDANRKGGILADALQKGIRGELCLLPLGKQMCCAEDCVVTVENLVPKLKPAVDETAAANECAQRIFFLSGINSTSTSTPPTPIGLAVNAFTEMRFQEASLPKEAELHAKLVVEDGEAFLWP